MQIYIKCVLWMTFDDTVDTNLHLLELKLIASLAPQEADRLAVLFCGEKKTEKRKKKGGISLHFFKTASVIVRVFNIWIFEFDVFFFLSFQHQSDDFDKRVKCNDVNIHVILGRVLVEQKRIKQVYLGQLLAPALIIKTSSTLLHIITCQSHLGHLWLFSCDFDFSFHFLVAFLSICRIISYHFISFRSFLVSFKICSRTCQDGMLLRRQSDSPVTESQSATWRLDLLVAPGSALKSKTPGETRQAPMKPMKRHSRLRNWKSSPLGVSSGHIWSHLQATGPSSKMCGRKATTQVRPWDQSSQSTLYEHYIYNHRL